MVLAFYKIAFKHNTYAIFNFKAGQRILNNAAKIIAVYLIKFIRYTFINYISLSL